MRLSEEEEDFPFDFVNSETTIKRFSVVFQITLNTLFKYFIHKLKNPSRNEIEEICLTMIKMSLYFHGFFTHESQIEKKIEQ